MAISPSAIIGGASGKKEKPPLHEYGDKVSSTTLLTHIGINSTGHSGIHTLTDNVVLVATGNLVLFVNYATGAVESMPGPVDGGVGAVAVHPSKNRFALCEKSFKGPRVVVCDYPSKKETHVMRNGAEQGYGACAFNNDGKLLATVATEPDYIITVWNWEQQAILLRNKAFSSDIFSVSFSPFSETMLVTSGLGHLKVWDMASTFTGLKLQGTVGKFGKVEISDIAGYIALPDGKVLSGSESGSLLLWEASLVKCELMRIDDAPLAAGTAAAVSVGSDSPRSNKGGGGEEGENETNANDEINNEDAAGDENATMAAGLGIFTGIPTVNGRKLLKCHAGNIEVVKLIEDNKIVMTAGHDGFVRYWSFSEIDNCEPSGLTHIVGVKLLKELYLGDGVKAKSVAISNDRTHWVILDESGSLRTFPRWSYSFIISGDRFSAPPAEQSAPSGPLLEFFDGPITCIVASPNDRSVVVGGRDGTVRLYDTPNKNEIYRAAFDDAVVLAEFMPKAVDPAGLTLFCAFANGVVRVLRKCRDGFEVLAAWRPHSAGLVGVAISADATQVYTAASDGTAFYSKLHCSTNSEGDLVFTPEPFGWCTIPDKVVPTSLEWSAEGDACFFGFASGMLLAVKPPTEKPNHDETFEYPISYAGVGYRQKKKPPQKEKKLVINPNDHQDESSSDEDEEDEDQGPWGISAIKRLPANKGYVVLMDKEELGYVYTLSIRYEGKLGPPPIPPTGVDPPGRVEEPGPNVAYRNLTPVGVSVSQDEKTLLVAFSHGEVIKRSLHDLANTKAPVSHARQFHDSVEGRVNGAALLFDNSALVTVGSDGLIATHTIDDTEPPTGKVNLVALPKCNPSKRQGKERNTASTAGGGSAGFVALSVEAQRRLEDQEAAEALAEGKRSIIKKKIASVHKEYLEILAQNDAAVGGQKLSEEELTLDPELLRLLELEKENRVDEASIEFSWRIAYKEQLLKQLRAAFVDTMTYDRFEVKSFDSSFSVASIRTPAFTPAQQEKLELLKQAIHHSLGIVAPPAYTSDTTTNNTIDENWGPNSPLGINLDQVPSDSHANSGVIPDGTAYSLDGQRSNIYNSNSNNTYDEEGNLIGRDGAAAATADDSEMGPPPASASDAYNNTAKSNANTEIADTLGRNKALKSQLDKAEERKRERQERKKGLEELLTRKPKPTDTDPTLEAEIRYAREHMGDRILKTAPEYRVPANLVPTAERKAKQLILLEHSTNCLRAAFNEKLIALRDLKKNVCVELNEDRKRLAEIIAILSLDDRELPAVFELCAEEEPEKRFEISEPALRKWAKGKAREQRKLEAQQRATKGFGADLANADDDEKASYDSDDSDAGSGAAQKRVSRLSGGHRESTFARKPSLLSLKEKLEMDLKVRLENVRLSELEEEEAIIQRETLMYEKGRLIRRLEAAKKAYDDKLLEFLQERTRLEADICMADMRALLLYREFRMLLNFKKKDEELEFTLDAKLAEQSRINARIRSITADIEYTKDKQLTVNEGFATNRHDAETHIKTAFPLQDQPYLFEVFNRKIKRVKVVDNDEDDDDAPTSSEDEEEDTTGDDFVEVKPPTCDEAPWQHLLQLREGRLDLEDAQASLKQKFNEFEKLLAKVKDKERTKIEKELADSRKAIDDFQLEKQRQLNLLETIVVLKLSQIQCLSDDRKVPHDLQKAPVIVFTETAINNLRSRIAELAEEKQELARKGVQLARAKQALLRRKSKRQLEHSEWEQRVNEVQLLKFGQRIDLEALENLAVDRETEELKQQLKIEEIKWERELRKQENRVKSLRHDNQSRIAENTMLLKDLGSVREEQQVLEHALTTSTQKIIGKMGGGSKVATAADRAQLKDLVVRQQQELDMLANEVTMLKRKGGHVYTPVIQRLQQQQAFSSSMPTASASASYNTPPQSGLNGSYSHARHPPFPSSGGDYQQQPSSAPSSQQLTGGLTGQRIAGGVGGKNAASGGGNNNNATSNIVVRPTVLSQSARGPTTSTSTRRTLSTNPKKGAASSSPENPSENSPSQGQLSPAEEPEAQ